MKNCKNCKRWLPQDSKDLIAKDGELTVGACWELTNSIYDSEAEFKTENSVTTVTFTKFSATTKGLLYTNENFYCNGHAELERDQDEA